MIGWKKFRHIGNVFTSFKYVMSNIKKIILRKNFLFYH